MARIPYLKQWAMIGTVLAAVLTLAASARTGGYFSTSGAYSGNHIPIFSGIGTSGSSAQLEPISTWRLALIDCFAIGWLLCAIMGTMRARPAHRVGRAPARKSAPGVGRQLVQSIRLAVLQAQIPPPGH